MPDENSGEGQAFGALFANRPVPSPFIDSLLANRPSASPPTGEDPAVSALRDAHGYLSAQGHPGAPHLGELLNVVGKLDVARQAAITNAGAPSQPSGALPQTLSFGAGTNIPLPVGSVTEALKALYGNLGAGVDFSLGAPADLSSAGPEKEPVDPRWNVQFEDPAMHPSPSDNIAWQSPGMAQIAAGLAKVR